MSDETSLSVPVAEAPANRFAERRTAARLAAVQILYQMEVSGKGWEAAAREFGTHSFAPDMPDIKRDEEWFHAVLEGVVAHQGVVDRAVESALKDNWKLTRLDATVRAILRAGAYELLERADVPSPVVLSSYTDIAAGFFDGPEPGFINAALETLAQTRQTEAADASTSS